MSKDPFLPPDPIFPDFDTPWCGTSDVLRHDPLDPSLEGFPVQEDVDEDE